MTQRTPLIVILGATACGKSRLAIELAQKFCGEIISADSMQVYKGLDIVTNKVTDCERKQAKHHMINFVDPMSRFSVIDFRDQSLDIITDLHKNNRVPIIVGGTNYYIESLLWKGFTFEPTLKESAVRNLDSDARHRVTLMDCEAKYLATAIKHTQEDLDDVDRFFSKRIYADGFEHIESDKLWSILEKVDPNMAHLYHPNDKRRIIRILQMIQENERQKNYSDLLDEVNRIDEVTDRLGGPLRFAATCVIWLHCDNEVLDKIMDDRVDSMLDKGLLSELQNFHKDYNEQRMKDGKEPDYSKGIFQSIGFKEFHEYLTMTDEQKHSADGKKVLDKAIKLMKLSTRRYARRQVKWIRTRLEHGSNRDLPALYKLTTSFDEEGWQKNVHEPVVKIVDCFIQNKTISDDLAALKVEPRERAHMNKPGKLHCEHCDRILIGTNFIEAHLKSKAHLRNVMQNQPEAKRQKIDDTTELIDNHPTRDEPEGSLSAQQ